MSEAEKGGRRRALARACPSGAEKTPRSSGRSPFAFARLHLVIFASLLAACTSVAVSIAAADVEDTSWSGPSLEEVRSGLSSDAHHVLLPVPDALAAEALPHEDLTRDEANELLEEVFGTVLPTESVLPEGLEVVEFYSDTVALVTNAEGGEQSALVESTVPLRNSDPSGDQAPVDLALQPHENELRPTNPLVDVRLPGQLGDGLSLPEENIRISLPDAPTGISPSTVDENVATYPNVAEDTTFAVAPTPTGLETFTLLQSPDAPTVQQFALGIPDLADVRQSENGGAEIRRGQEILATILPPSAVDAGGNPVPVRLDVSGNGFSLITTPTLATEFPVLVDPVVETYSWRQGSSAGAIGNDWRSFSNSSQFQAFGSGYCPACTGGWATGLVLKSGTEWVNAGSQARWDYHVPRWGEDFANPRIKARPTTFVQGATFWNLFFDSTSGLARPLTTDPFMSMYIWDDNNGFVSIARRLGTEGNLTDMNYQYRLVNPNNNVGAKQVSLELVSTQNQTSQYRQLYVGSASIELSDNDIPSIGMLGNPTQWVNEKPSATIPFAVADPGLGVFRLIVEQPDSGGPWRAIGTNAGCSGAFASACPPIWEHTTSGRPQIGYDPSTMPQGEQWLRFFAMDPLGKKSEGGQVRLKVDHGAPALSLSGRLTEQSKYGSTASQYALKYSATDGDHEAAAPLSAVGSAGTGLGQMQRPMGVAVDSADNLWVVDRENNRVQKFASTGKLLLQFGSAGQGPGQFLDPCAIAVSANGTVWVSEMGNRRVQAFNSKGEYLKSFGHASFVQPYGIAPAAGEILWVADPGAHAVFKFNDSGALLGVIDNYAEGGRPNTLPELKSPMGVVADSRGNVWIADSAANRIFEYSPAAEFRSEFGSYGTGDGQLQGPRGIAVTRSGNLLVTDDLNNRVQEFEVSGAFLRKFGSLGAGLGEVDEPRGVAVGSGGITYVADAGNRRIARWSHGDYNPQSGVVSTEVKVDGQLVEPRYEPGCSTRDCAITREWVLKASNYPSGPHTLAVTAKDGVGLPTTRTQAFSTVKDTTAPQITVNGPFFTGPEGWLEQKYYLGAISASDIGGYGVSSLVFKIDGAIVDSRAEGCLQGGCEASILSFVDVAKYKGGAHSYEVVATDAGGNVSKKAGIINVDPKGQVSVAEAVDTLDALEETSDGEVLSGALLPEEAGASLPSYQDEGEGVASVDAPVPSSIGSDVAQGITLETADGVVEIDPLTVSESAPEDLVANGDALVASNSAAAADLVVRPVYAGAMTFQAIRDANAPTQYAWEVRLDEDQSLKQIDSQFAQVYTDGTYPSFGIRVTAAHDAVGTSVPTSLSVSEGKIITLTVQHKPVSGQTPFVYPVVAGTGWEGGFQTHQVEMPPANPPADAKRDVEEYFGGYGGVSPPLPIDGSDPEASASGVGGVKKWFLWVECSHTGRWIEEASGVREPEVQTFGFDNWTEDCGNPFQNEPGKGIAYRAAYHGKYFIKEGIKVWHEGGPTDGIGCKTDTRKDVANPANLEEGVSWKQRRSYVDRCVWWGPTRDGGGQSAPYGKHITPVGRFVGEMRGGCGDSCGGTPNPWKQFTFPPMAYYLWASGHVKFHPTDCIDCY